ncbi:MAG: PilN domain-containing protein [Cyanobacteria bacterium J06621_11]
MYGIDINFLNDRSDRPVDALATVIQPKSSGASKRMLPVIGGVIGALVALGGVGGYWLILNRQQTTLTAESGMLDSQLAELQQKLSQVDTVRQQTAAVNGEIQSLAGVFERIRPWSAIVRDMQGRIPARTQISKIVQQAPAEGGSPAGAIELGGNACSFDDVNDFMLTLKKSPFLESETIKIVNAALGSSVPGRCPGAAETEEESQLVTYTITGDIKSLPAAALLDELNRQQESTGLAARIRALQTTGAIN